MGIHKTICWRFNWGYIEFIDQIWKNWHLDNTESSYPWTWNISLIIWFLLWCLSSQFCSLPHIDLLHILLELYLSVSFLLVPVEMYNFLKISNSTCSLLVNREARDICILSLCPAPSLYYKYLLVPSGFLSVFSNFKGRQSCHMWTKTVLFLPSQSVKLKCL